MPNYNDAQGVADLLSQFDFNIISEGPGDFSTQHRKYTCEFSKPGIESFTTTYQSNPDVHGQPTATDVFAALASDALAVDGLLVDTFADELGFEKPSQAIRAYESCHKTLDWLKNDLQLMTSEISDIAETLDNELGEVKEQVERVQEERKAKHEFEHPPVPEVGEPYQVEAHPKSQEPSQPRLAEKVKETRDGSGKLEQDSHDGQTTEREDEREDERADGDAEH